MSSGSVTGYDVFLAGKGSLMPCRFIGDESGLQTAGIITLGHFSLLVREGNSLVVKAAECSLEKWFSSLPSFLCCSVVSVLLIFCRMNHGNHAS